MILQTQIPLKKQADNQIDYSSKLILIGSCFSENIGDKLAYYQFQTIVNPFGILFHPKAIEKLITDVINNKTYSEKDVFFNNEQWHSFNAHSSLSNANKETLLTTLNTTISKTNEQLKEATHVVITLGTSWIYKHIISNTVVANCHKVPQKEFSKEILSVDEISQSLHTIVSLVKSINKNVSIIFTVSPVRHTKDGFIENMQSKSHLISGIHQFLASTSLSQQNSTSQNQQNNYYFPSYEIMMDELRDYRFYSEDMIHPNQTAINYIWDKFSFNWITDEALKTMDEVATIQKGLAHKPFNPTSEQHLKFLKKLSTKKETLLKSFPFMEF